MECYGLKRTGVKGGLRTPASTREGRPPFTVPLWTKGGGVESKQKIREQGLSRSRREGDDDDEFSRFVGIVTMIFSGLLVSVMGCL
ncbi:hypothetical protein Q3G72_006453 [Acer saccharum]|nr:hypothetical protein Q3G72_006453 [Acer saccharum]